MKAGLKALAPSFLVPRLEGRELAEIYFLLRMDCPEIFYTVKFSYRFYPDSENVEFVPEYLFPKKQIQEHQKAMESRVKKLARQAEHLDEWEKLLFVHDFACQNVRYDKLKKPYSHEIIGPLGQGVGVCEGIAKAVKILCDALGIWCILVLSEANPEKQIQYRHAWNLVRIKGNYYHLDATFDNTLSRSWIERAKNEGKAPAEGVRYDYVCLSDGQIFRDHEPTLWKVPACPDGDHFYYREKKLSFTKYEEVRKRAAQAVKKGKSFLFHWRGGYLTREVLRDLLQILEEEAGKREQHAYVFLNWPQAVLQVRFQKETAEQPMVLEEANEERVQEGIE